MEIAEITFRQTYCVQMVRASFQFLHSPDYSSFLFLDDEQSENLYQSSTDPERHPDPTRENFFQMFYFQTEIVDFVFSALKKFTKGLQKTQHGMKHYFFQVVGLKLFLTINIDFVGLTQFLQRFWITEMDLQDYNLLMNAWQK